jgi:hypothetical protein
MMRTIEDHLKKAMSDAAVHLGLQEEQIKLLEEYLDGGAGETEFLDSLQKLDLSTLTDASKGKLKACYDSLKKHKVEAYLDKYLKLLIAVFEKQIVKIIAGWEYNLNEDTCKRLLSCGANPASVISYYADLVQQGEHHICMSQVQRLEELYRDYETAFREAAELCDINGKLYLSAYLAMKDPQKYGDCQKYIENCIKSSLQVLFSRKTLSEESVKEMIKYIDGGLFVTDKIVEQLKAYVGPMDIEMYILKFLLALAYMISNTSTLGKRFIKFAVLLCYKEALSRLHDFVKVGYNADKAALEEVEAVASKVKIPHEYIIAWMGSSNGYSGHRFENELMKKLKENKKEFEAAIKLADNEESFYLTSILWKSGSGNEYIGQAEERFLEELTNYFLSQSIPNLVRKDIVDYLKGEKELDSIKVIIRNAAKSTSGYHYYGNNEMDMLFRMKEKSSIFNRAIKLYPQFYNYSITERFVSRLRNAYNIKDLKGIIDLLSNNGVDNKALLYYIVEVVVNSYNSNYTKEAVNLTAEFISKDRAAAGELIADCSAQGRAILLEGLYNNDSKETIPVLISYMEDTSKVVKDMVSELLSRDVANISAVAPYLLAKKQAMREMAVRVLSSFRDAEAVYLLQKSYETEKSEKVKAVIAKVLNISEAAAVDSNGSDIEDYCKSIIKRSSKTALKWLDFDTLPEIRLKDKESNASEDISAALLIAYSSNGTIALSTEAKTICQVLEEKDVKELALQVLQRWLENGAEVKKKWAMAFSAVHGDYRVVELLKKNIEEWPLKARGAIACEAVRALALNGSNSALMIVDGISRKFKFKQVKEAAAAALTYAAEQLGMDKEELSDKIVPSLGFDSRGERSFDYGGRSFTVRLTTELSLEIIDENEKLIKKLPEASKKDDAEKAATAQAEFKELKKQLKNTVNIQAMRLELALSANRLWSKTAWTSLFVDNPIMHQFAMGLIWGVYEENKLKDTFRYMEDGTFNTKDEDEYELAEGSLIGLVHPIELTAEDRELWKEQLENYEIKQPFLQIERPVYVVTEEEKEAKSVDRFGGIIINSLSLMGKLTAAGWYRGSVRDGGGFYDFYKEDKNHGIGANLEFSGDYVGSQGEEVTIYDLAFYKAGTVERGSYVYDSVKEQHLIKPAQVPARLFSEFLYNVDKAVAAQVGVDENWKVKR